MKNRQSLKQQQTNANYTAWSKLAVAQHWMLKSWQENQRLGYALMLLPASLVLSGCATQAPKHCEPLPVVSRPALQYPLPTTSYLSTYQADTERARSKLMSTSSTFEFK